MAAEETKETAVDTLIREVGDIVVKGGGEEVITCAVAEVLEKALAAGLNLDPSITAPSEERYVMYPIYVAPDKSFSIASAVWNIGQETPIHAHSVWGVVGIYAGGERELRFAYPEPSSTGPVNLLGEEVWGPGQVTVCCTTDQDIHKVSCASDVPCVGIHIYGGDIGETQRKSYDPDTSEVSYFVSHWAAPVTT